MKAVLCSNKESVRTRWRESLQSLHWELHDVQGSERLIEASNGFSPQMILLHLPLADANRAAMVVSAIARYPQAKLIVFCDVPSDDDGLIMLKTGVAGYCNTYMHPQMLHMAVEIVRGGEIWAGQSLIRKLVSTVSDAAGRQSGFAAGNGALASLTGRETEIARLVASGASNKRVAQKLDIAERTVKSHMTSLFRKTGTRDRLQLALLVNAGVSA